MQERKSTLLVVDDQPKNLQLIATVLKDQYKLILANNGQKAIEVAKEKAPDLILLDVMMPEISGYDVCRKLKQDDLTKNIPVIFLTAKTEEEDIMEAYEVGGVDYVTKPFKARELAARIQAHIRLRNQQKEITELNKKLTSSNLQKDKLFTVIAHDLRGPANSVHAALEVLGNMTENLSRDDLEKFLEMLKTNTKNLRDLLEDLLLWSGKQFEKEKFEPKNLNLIELVDHVFDHLKPQADAKNIRLIYDTNDDLTIHADRDMFTMILRNLIANAIKFSKVGSSVRVESGKVAKDNISISVIDRGMGIKEEDLDKIFDASVLFTTYGTMGEKGTGIGLDICKEFAERQGGEIKVESKVGVGSSFTFTVPEYR